MTRTYIYVISVLLLTVFGSGTTLAGTLTASPTGMNQFGRSLTREAGISTMASTGTATETITSKPTIQRSTPPTPSITNIAKENLFSGFNLTLLGLTILVICSGLLWRFIYAEHRLTTEIQKFGSTKY